MVKYKVTASFSGLKAGTIVDLESKDENTALFKAAIKSTHLIKVDDLEGSSNGNKQSSDKEAGAGSVQEDRVETSGTDKK